MFSLEISELVFGYMHESHLNLMVFVVDCLFLKMQRGMFVDMIALLFRRRTKDLRPMN